MATKTTTLQLMKSTGNTHVYHEEGHERHKQVFPTIYVQKQVLSDPPPDKVTVTIEWENGK
jgi:hypothetical protein